MTSGQCRLAPEFYLIMKTLFTNVNSSFNSISNCSLFIIQFNSAYCVLFLINGNWYSLQKNLAFVKILLKIDLIGSLI